MSAYIARRETSIDCSICERMGRVTVIRQNGTLSTATCANCNGYGFVEPCIDPECKYCVAAHAKAQPVTPLF